MLILHDPNTLLHDTVELLGSRLKPALESPDRIKNIIAEVSESSNHVLENIESPVNSPNVSSVLKKLLELIRQTHGEDYLNHLEQAFDNWRRAHLIEQHESILPECFPIPNKARAIAAAPKDIYARAGFFAFDMSSGIMEKTYVSAIASAHLAFSAVQRIQHENSVRNVLALCRPPGHHCDGNRAGGYCYVNNAAVAISTWRMQRPDARIGMLDLDFHHGNGTQDIFYSDPKVFYTSIHGEDEFPYYTGRADETGSGEAVGTKLNLPLQPGSSFDQYLSDLEIALDALQMFNCEVLLVSLGFDTFHLDPLGSFKIYTEDYEVMARTVRSRLSNMPAIILLEGGYALEHLGANVLAFLKGWESKP